MALFSGKTWSAIISVILLILKPLLKIVTPQLDEQLKSWIRDFAAKCYASPNPWDDLLADFLKTIFDVE